MDTRVKNGNRLPLGALFGLMVIMGTLGVGANLVYIALQVPADGHINPPPGYDSRWVSNVTFFHFGNITQGSESEFIPVRVLNNSTQATVLEVADWTLPSNCVLLVYESDWDVYVPKVVNGLATIDLYIGVYADEEAVEGDLAFYVIFDDYP